MKTLIKISLIVLIIFINNLAFTEEFPYKNCKKIAEGIIPSDGKWVTTPSFEKDFKYFLVIKGTFSFEYAGLTFDALYVLDKKGQLNDYLQFNLAGITHPIEENQLTNRYVFKIPENGSYEGKSLGIRIDNDLFVTRYLIPPSQVLSSLKSNMQFELWRKPLYEKDYSIPFLISGILLITIIGGYGFISFRKMDNIINSTPQGFNINEQLKRIKAKEKILLSSLPKGDGEISSIASKIPSLKEGAISLGLNWKKLRKEEIKINKEKLIRELEQIKEKYANLKEAELKSDYEQLIAEKEKVLRYFEDNKRYQNQIQLRLEKIEAVLEAMRLKISNLQFEKEELIKSIKHSLHIKEIDDELKLISETLKDLKEIL